MPHCRQCWLVLDRRCRGEAYRHEQWRSLQVLPEFGSTLMGGVAPPRLSPFAQSWNGALSFMRSYMRIQGRDSRSRARPGERRRSRLGHTVRTRAPGLRLGVRSRLPNGLHDGRGPPIAASVGRIGWLRRQDPP